MTAERVTFAERWERRITGARGCSAVVVYQAGRSYGVPAEVAAQARADGALVE